MFHTCTVPVQVQETVGPTLPAENDLVLQLLIVRGDALSDPPERRLHRSHFGSSEFASTAQGVGVARGYHGALHNMHASTT